VNRRVRVLGIFCALLLGILGFVTARHLLARPQVVPVTVKPPVVRQTDSWALPDRYKNKVIGLQPHAFQPRTIALTFDDGPDHKLTPKVLNILRQYHAKATFFVVGKRASRHPELLRQIVREGHVIGNHTFSHPGHATPEAAAYEVAQTKQIIENAIGRKTTLFRPPYGHRYNALSIKALEQGYSLALWSLQSKDASRCSGAKIRNTVLSTRRRGDVVVLHDGPGHEETIDALPGILTGLSRRGYRFVTLPQMLQGYDTVLTARAKAKALKMAKKPSSRAALAPQRTKNGEAAIRVATRAVTKSDGTK